jgi:glycerophosphoryl diester phosphodiesterase
MANAPHPDSLIHAPGGRTVYFKVHRCLWSGESPENSLAAIRECYRAGVARAEIDLNMLEDADFLVTHDSVLDHATTGTGSVSQTTRQQAATLRFRWRGAVSEHRPPLLSEVVALIREEAYPTRLELDVKDFGPWPWPRVEELARLVEPVRDRVIFGGCPDWNLRRLLHVDPTLPVGFNPAYYLDWVPDGEPTELLPGRRGAHGYLDAHPLAWNRYGPTTEYLRDRLGGLIELVPNTREIHLRLAMFERMLDDGLAGAAHLFGDAGLIVDVWTLDAGTPRWRERLARAVDAGVDMVTTNTPRELAAAWRAENGAPEHPSAARRNTDRS